MHASHQTKEHVRNYAVHIWENGMRFGFYAGVLVGATIIAITWVITEYFF